MDVVVNAAMSADGKLSSRRREQIKISGEADFARVDELRASVDAIVVGIGTVLADDPSLTVDSPTHVETRETAGDPPQPARVVVDSTARTSPDARVLDASAETYVASTFDAPAERIEALESAGATVVQTAGEHVDLASAFARLEDHGIEHVLIEGGGELIYSCVREDLVDELLVYVGPTIIGGRDAPTLVDGDGFVEDFPTLSLDDVERIDDGVLLRWTVES